MRKVIKTDIRKASGFIICALLFWGLMGWIARADCQLEVQPQLHEQWESEGAFFAKVTIGLSNKAGSEASDWKLVFQAPEGGEIQDIWNGVQAEENGNMIITAAGYNAVIQAGETVEPGFIIRTAGKMELPEVTAEAQIDGKKVTAVPQGRTAEKAGEEQPAAESDDSQPAADPDDREMAESGNAAVSYDGKGVSAHGQLKVENARLVDETGEPVILHGMSSHGIAWYPRFTNEYTLKKIKEKGANVFRAAMYTSENGGYCEGNAQEAKRLTFEAVDRAIALDMYAVIDWHILSDNSPQIHKEEALAFFEEASAKYAGNPAVIYEICNEPNGTDWSSQIKPYASEVIPVIRKNSPDAVILVGTNTWCQDVDVASMDKLEFDNVMYTFHFYAGTHTLDGFRGKIETALNNGCGIFVSEWGTSRADGGGGVFLEESRRWLDYLEEKGISWINWSLSDKEETSAAFLPGTDSESFGEENLSESGRFVLASMDG